MKKITLSAYSIRVREKRKKDITFLPLHNINGIDFYEFVEKALKDFSNHISDFTELQKVIQFPKVEEFDQKRMLAGISKSGEYGFQSELVNVKNNQTTHQKTIDEAEVLPFFFQLFLPQENIGMLILQNFSVFGIVSIFKKWLTKVFDKEFDDYTLDFNPLIPEEYFKSILQNGELTTVIFRKLELPSDLSDTLGYGSLKSSEGTFEQVIKSKSPLTQFTRAILQNLSSNHVEKLYEIVPKDIVDYDDILVKIKVGQSTRTFNLGKLDRLNAILDISNEVDTGIDGHPEYESILGISTSYIESLVEKVSPPADQ